MTYFSDPAQLFPATALPRTGLISLVGAGPGAADLLTFRAANRIAEADVVFHDRLVDPEVLALARGQKVYVGKDIGAHAWPQARIDAEIVAAARRGLRVVRLKSGDPSIFGRAAEEIAAARAHGIAVEVIPGITAASAAAAALCEPLTTRGQTDSLVLSTATPCPGMAPADLAARAQPGTTLVLYMAMHRLAEVSAELLGAGLPPETVACVAANVSKADQATLTTTLAALPAACRAAGLRNPAVVLIRVPKAGALAVATTKVATVLA